MQLSAGTIVDRYSVERVLGEGGMATVYKVRHLKLQSAHALKVLTVGGAVIGERLLQEGRVQSALRHANIVSVTDVVEVDGRPALIMEFIDGPTLLQLMEGGRLDLDKVDALVQGILRGVAAAHDQGLVHRDLKPANILLATQDGRLVPKVADFGIARLTTAEGSPIQTRTGVAMGTPAYMAPEQIRDASRVDRRADIFALGCILYELTTGVRAFQGTDTYEVFEAIIHGRFAPLPPHLPARMRIAIEGALRVDPDRRWAHVEALLDAWRGEVGEVPTVAGAPAFSPRSLAGDTLGEWQSEPLADTPSIGSTLAGAEAAVDPPSLTAHWLPLLAGTLLGAAPMAAIALLVFGSLERARDNGGTVLYLVGPLGLLCFGLPALLGAAERAGQRFVGAWLALPALTGLLGMLAMAVAQLNMLQMLDQIGVGQQGFQLAMVTSTALTAKALALATAMAGFLVSALALAWVHRSAGASARELALPLLAGGLGGGLWLLAGLSRGSFDAGGTIALGALLLGVGATVLVAPAAARVRGLVGGASLLGLTMAALLSLVLGPIAQFDAIGTMSAVDKAEGIDRLASAILSPDWRPALAWILLGALLALSPWLARPPAARPFRRPESAALLSMGGALAVVWGLSDHALRRAGDHLLPTFLGSSIDDFLGFTLHDPIPGRDPAWATGGLVVGDVKPGAPLSDGDVVNAVGGTPVRSARDLRARLYACTCEGEGGVACTLARACIRPGSLLDLSVILAPEGEGDPRLTSVRIPALPAEAVDGAATTEALTRAFEQPLFDFVMEPNAEISERSSLRQAENWDQALVADIDAASAERLGQPAFFTRLEEVVDEWATVLGAVRAAGLPEVISAIPYAESRYEREHQSSACAKGYWQFMPETAHRMQRTVGVILRVEGCRFDDDPSVSWSPTADTVGPFSKAPYLRDGACRIRARRGCAVDDRTDLAASTAAAVAELALAWQDADILDSGAAVQLTIASHNAGYDDGRFARSRRYNIRPALLAWREHHEDALLPAFYGQQAGCGEGEDCDRLLHPETTDYVVNVLATHLIAVCYYALNHSDVDAFSPWSRYQGGYCRDLGIPSAAGVVRGGVGGR